MSVRLAFVLMACQGLSAFAAEVEKKYFLGEATLSGDKGQSFGAQVILLEKIHDPGQSMIIERAVVAKQNGQGAEEHVMTMKVQGDKFTISDGLKTIQGTGVLFGPAWRWTYFKASYESTNGATIEDENFMNDPDILVARKKISTPAGQVIMYMDVALKAITPETFKILSSNLLKKEGGQPAAKP